MDGMDRYEAGRRTAQQWLLGETMRAKPVRKALKLERQRILRRIRHLVRLREVSGADRWLMENQYLVLMAAQSAEEGFRVPGRFPSLEQPGRALRIIALARSLNEQPEPLTARELTQYLHGVQSVSPLQGRELRALLPALQYAALEQLSAALEEPEAQREERFRKAFGTLRRWNDLDFQLLAEQVSPIHAAFLEDPSGDYPRMTAQDRARYRQKLERMARRRDKQEEALAREVVEQAAGAHIGGLLFPPVRRPGAAGFYFPLLMLFGLGLSVYLALKLGMTWSALLLWMPVLQVLKTVTDALILRFLSPRPVFRMALPEGIPASARTLVVKTTLLTGEGNLEEVRHLERLYLANRDCGGEVSFGLLADLAEGDAPMGQEERNKLRQVELALDALNARYDGRFFLFFRPPVYQSASGKYAGWERKRGALLELGRMLRAQRSGMEVYSGERTRLNRVKYLVTLDSDTGTGVGGVRALVGAMLHPLNRPRLDEQKRIVTKGYGILQPQIRTELSSARVNAFARLFSGSAGSDPYRGTSSELCHDLFDEASFSGKGIIDIDCFLTCMDGRFPDQRVLSHDILEGAYLRAGCLSQVSFTDRFPTSVGAYYKRQHRWVRGDWQNIPWLFRRVSTREIRRGRNPISAVSRWKLADNLRRSLVPIAQLACVLTGVLFGGGLGWLVWISVASLAVDSVLSFFDRAVVAHALRRFHSKVLPELGRILLSTAVRLVLLPLEAWTNLSALCTALWRSLVSHRNLLQWTTSASQSARRSSSLRTAAPIMVSGIFLGLFAAQPLSLILAFTWILSPLVIWVLERKQDGPRLRAGERTFLLHEAEQIWGYFADFLTAERNYLPPDNVQLRPYRGVAERTSPTNIGFAALSCLAAVDLDLEPKELALKRVEGMLSTLERMEKWRGNLYNWYHTVTLQPMEPKVISSVDSGNLCAALFALGMGLRQMEEEELAQRALKLARATDLGALYDKEKRLFYISYAPGTGAWSDAHYDLMASEARLLSYVALAEGMVDRRHWKALSRVQTASHRYQGMASWFGTMFEYFMPHLLLPLPKDSFLYESLAFCVCEQLRYGREKGAPWGVSESAVPELDQNGCYGYRANGVPALALCGAAGKGYVAAPYATYLALSVLPHLAIANLRRLHGDALEGKYGLYEAAEYRDGAPHPAKSWMAHHMGMSLLAIDNALRDQIQVRRFLSWPAMSAYVSLLEEPVPRRSKPIDLKRLRPAAVGGGKQPRWQTSGEGYSPCEPVCAVMTGGGLATLLCNNGGGWMTGEGITLTPRRRPPAFYLLRRGMVTQLFPCAEGAEVRWCMSREHCEFSLMCEDMDAHLCVSQLSDGAAEWTIRLSGGAAPLDGTLLFSLSPQIASEREYLAHPAFCGLTVEILRMQQGVRFHRRSASGAWPDFRCTWAEESVRCHTGREALERQLALGLPGFEPGVLLEMPIEPALGKQARLRLRFDLGEPVHAAKTNPAVLPPEALDLAFRLLPGLVFAPQLGREGNPGPQRLLWKYGVSGDDPILLSELPEDDGERDLLFEAKRCLASGGIGFDLVLLSRDEAHLAAFRRWAEGRGLVLGGHCGVHLAAETPESAGLFRGMCSARMDQLPERRTEFPIWGTKRSWPLPGGDIQYDWGEDTFRLHCRDSLPAVRWSIPLTNGSFGYLAMETGGGYLWSGNSRIFQITPWDNDPWAAEGPEQLVLCQGGREISLFAARDGRACDVTFGPGYLKWEKQLETGAAVTLTAFVPPDRNERVFLLEGGAFSPDAVLLWRLKPQLGEHLIQGLWVRASEDKGVVWLKNPVSERAGISLCASVPWRTVRLPEGRRRTVELTIPLEGALVLQAGEGCPPLTPEEAKTALAGTVSHWRAACGALRVQTPDSALNHYLSFWSQYQIQASRMLARTSVYQCGGAYGFRDQLQDACALLRSRPELAKRQILRCCGHQFEEGDVLHWWHEAPGGGADAGVRTRMTDDLLWLPYAVSVWWEETGDRLLLEETVTYLTGERLAPQEWDRYFTPNAGGETESVYRHCVRALECMLGRGVGEHGLCRVGGGDWNDGMDRVGTEGRGESVWLSWFAALVLRRFAQVCDDMLDRERGDRYRGLARRLARAAEDSWDGAWYLRGWFDSGHPLGGRNCPECQIDSLAQSFAVFAGGDPARTKRALESAESLLLHPREQTLGLLFPAFDFQGDFPGYIANYRPGARENGGQYTHAAVWMAQAWLKLGNADRGWALLQALLPERHPIRRYRGEPFVLAGDVSLEPGKEGTAGWTWYTGAAGWYDRAAVQDLLGIRFRKGLLHLEPCLPARWEGYQAQLSLGSCRLSIEVVRSGVERLTLDGTMIPQGVDCAALTGHHLLRLEILRKMGCGPEENHV